MIKAEHRRLSVYRIAASTTELALACHLLHSYYEHREVVF